MWNMGRIEPLKPPRTREGIMWHLQVLGWANMCILINKLKQNFHISCTQVKLGH